MTTTRSTSWVEQSGSEWLIRCGLCPNGLYRDALGTPLTYLSREHAEAAQQRHDRHEHSG